MATDLLFTEAAGALEGLSKITEGAEKATGFLAVDTELLNTLGDERSTQTLEKITGHLIESGRPASAEYMNLYFDSALLDQELMMLEAGNLDVQAFENAGLPMFIDVEGTTSEMLAGNKAMLTPEARSHFLGLVHTLKYKMDGHIGKTAERASAYFADELANGDSILKSLQKVLKIETNPDDIPFIENWRVTEKLEELSGRKFISRAEKYDTVKRELLQLMKQEPKTIGLGTTASASEALGRYAVELAENQTEPVNTLNLRNIHTYFRNQGMQELEIHPDFGTQIENRIQDNLALKIEAETPNAEIPEILQAEVVYANGEWLVDNIDEKTKEWLLGNGHENVASQFSATEQQQANKFAETLIIEAQARSIPPLEGKTSPVDALKEIQKDEADREAMKLLLRIAIKVGTKVAVTVAKNIAKDKDTPPELRMALGIFSDLAESGGKVADIFISGQENPKLAHDCLNFISSRYSSEKH